MSFSVIVNESTAPPAKGAPTDTGTGFYVGVIGGGDSTKANLVNNMDEFEGIYTTRAASGAAPLYDAVDAFFGEGGSRAYIGGYTSGGGHTYDNGLALLDDRRYGPGQLSIIGTALSSPIATDVAAFIGSNNRIFLGDVANNAATSDMETTATLLPDNADDMALFGSWVSIPGPNGVIGASARVVPASAVIAGMCNRVDMDGNPNRAPGGRDYPLQYVNGLVSDPSDADRAALLAVGVNTFANDNGLLINAGFQTNIPQSAYETTPFWQLNCARARMWLKAQIQAVAANYYMRPIDGRGRLAAQLVNDLDGVCNQLWQANGLYGDTPAEAYKNTVTSTIDQIAQGSLVVKCEAKFSLYAKSITVDLLTIPVAGTV